MPSSPNIPGRPDAPQFATTRWSVVAAARDRETPEAAVALEVLCRTYWTPLYAYARRRGQSPHDAEDLTQDFFATLLAKDYLQAVQRERGPFRQFLLMTFKRFLANDWDRTQRLKRGGGQRPVPFDTALAERLYREEPGPDASADDLYDRRWAVTLLEQALARLRGEFESEGKLAEYDTLKPCLTAARGEINYPEIAATLGTSEAAARVAVHRLRKRYRETFREELTQTVANEPDFENELRHLLSVLGR